MMARVYSADLVDDFFEDTIRRFQLESEFFNFKDRIIRKAAIKLLKPKEKEFKDQIEDMETTGILLVGREREMPKPWENKSGCKDPTAYRGDTAISKGEERVGELVHVLKYIIHLAGFELVERINLRDKRSGRTYR